MLFERLAELQGQRNVTDAQILDVVRELGEDDLWGVTGARSLESCVAWKSGSSASHARSLAAVARRADTFPRCVAGLREGVLSLDQVAVIAERAVDGSDEHYAALAGCATVSQLRTALNLAPRPDDQPTVEAERSVTKTTNDEFAIWRVKLPHVEAAVFDAALQSHLDALAAEWRRDHGEREEASEQAPPFPTVADAFMRLVEHGWDADAVARPHGHRTTVVVHLDLEREIGSLHLGPALTLRPRARSDGHRRQRTDARWFVGGPTADGPTARRPGLRRAHRRAGRLEVVGALRSSGATQRQLSGGAAESPRARRRTGALVVTSRRGLLLRPRPALMTTIRTVGHGTVEAEELGELLRGAGATELVDVRRFPGSRRHPQFSSETMAAWLPEHGVGYRHLESLGGRRKGVPGSPHIGLRNDSFRAYADHMTTDEFAAGVAELLDMAADESVAVMCSESEWLRCHRRLLADHLVLVHGVVVEHLFHGGRLTEHDPTPEARLVGEQVVYDVGVAPPLFPAET